MQPKKILYIITQSEWGGAQKYVFDLAENFIGQDIKIGVAAGTEKNDLFNNLGKIESQNLKIFRLSHLKRQINPYRDILAFFQIIKIIIKFKPDIVHLNSSKAGIIGTFAAKICRKKVVYTAHGFVFNENLPILIFLIYWISEKISSFFRNKIITVSHYDFRSAIEKKVIKEKKMVVIHNGIEINKKNELFSKIEARGRIKEIANSRQCLLPAGDNLFDSADIQMVGTVANLYETKGLKYLIEAADLVLQDMPNVIFIVIGDGPLKNKLAKIIKDHKLQNNFFILGKIENAYKYLSAFDVFCLASIKEGLAYSLLEALAAGLPIVATNAGGSGEVVKNEENGFIVPYKNKEVLAEKLKFLLKNSDLRNKMAKRSSELAENFSIDKMIEKTMQVYKSL